MMPTSFSELTADQRLQHLTFILALAVRRYHRRLRRTETSPQDESPDSGSVFLEIRGDPRLTGSRRIEI